MQVGWPDGIPSATNTAARRPALPAPKSGPRAARWKWRRLSQIQSPYRRPVDRRLTQGGSWTSNTTPTQLTYSLDLAPGGLSWSEGPGSTADAVARALQEWSNVADITFTKVGIDSNEQFNTSTADMAFSLSYGQMIRRFGLIGFAEFPDPSISDNFRNQAGEPRLRTGFDGNSYPHPEGDVFIEDKWSGFSDTQPGGRRIPGDHA